MGDGMSFKYIILGASGALIAAAIVAYFSLTVFVIQPIGAVPDGKTIVIGRVGKTRFVDSADAICDREMGGVNLLCRGVMMGNILNNATVYLRLPYSETLYLWSTGGRDYGR